MPVDPNSAKAVFFAALDKTSPDERAAFLSEACAGDGALRRRVEELLHAHEQSGEFLDSPAVAMAAPADSSDQTEALTNAPGNRAATPSRGPSDLAVTRAEHSEDADDSSLDFLTPSSKPGSFGRFLHYEVLEVLGKGGFGTVLKAFDEKLHRVVAIKVLSPQLASSGTARRRFLREARATAAVRNDHVVAIHAVDEHPTPYLVMECILGQTLQQKLDRTGALEVKEVLRIGMQIADGLAAAHKQGLVHRDIKPANILLENGVERVKITDFGLARAVDDASLSQSGVVAGTPMYMSPEQAQGETADHRADLFSLGSTLYVMCTGRPPFRATSTLAVLKRVCEETPRPIREINPDIPDWLTAIVEKLHAKQPENRFQTAKEVADLLGQHLAHLQQPSRVAPPPRPEVAFPPGADEAPFSIQQLPWAAWIGCALWASVLVVALVEVQHALPARIARGVGTLLLLAAVAYALSYAAVGFIRRARGGMRPGREPRPYRIVLFLGIPLVCTTVLLLQWVGNPIQSVRALFESLPHPASEVRPEEDSGWEPLFNRKDLDGWEGDRTRWSWKDGALTGSTLYVNEVKTHLLRSTKVVKDFELKFQARLDGSFGIAGVRVRGKAGLPIGPARHLGKFYTVDDIGKYLKTGKNQDRLEKVLKLGFNEFHLRCVGKHVTLTIDGITTIDDDFDDLPDEGTLAFRIMSGPNFGAQVTFRDVQIRELPPVAPPGKKAEATAPFALLARGTRAEQSRATLAEAVTVPQAGDTIEVSGNGPCLTGPSLFP